MLQLFHDNVRSQTYVIKVKGSEFWKLKYLDVENMWLQWKNGGYDKDFDTFFFDILHDLELDIHVERQSGEEGNR